MKRANNSNLTKESMFHLCTPKSLIGKRAYQIK